VNRLVVGGRGSVLVGDKVLCTRNQPAGGARNGDVGVVVGFSGAKALVSLEGEGPGRAPRRISRADLKHGYCVTVHKSQGSEWPSVLFLAAGSRPGDFFHKKLLYTAVTRAKGTLTVAGRRTLLEAVALTPAPERFTAPLAEPPADPPAEPPAEPPAAR
jgi:exodeoxyribonuclease V alpha subunit